MATTTLKTTTYVRPLVVVGCGLFVVAAGCALATDLGSLGPRDGGLDATQADALVTTRCRARP